MNGSTDKALVILGTLDTKGPETAFLRDCLHGLGGKTRVMDAGLLSPPAFSPDVTREEIAARAGTSMDTLLRKKGDKVEAIEAMARGRPVVVPNITALPEMVIDGENGYLFAPGDTEDLENKLMALAELPNIRVRMGAAGRRRSEECFDLDTNAAQLMAMFARELPWMSSGRQENDS